MKIDNLSAVITALALVASTHSYGESNISGTASTELRKEVVAEVGRAAAKLGQVYTLSVADLIRSKRAELIEHLGAESVARMSDLEVLKAAVEQ